MQDNFDYDQYMKNNPLLSEEESDSRFYTKKDPILAKHQNKTGPLGLIVSDLNNLEKVLNTLRKQPDVGRDQIIDLVIKTIKDIKSI
jgi:hypothetical protein